MWSAIMAMLFIIATLTTNELCGTIVVWLMGFITACLLTIIAIDSFIEIFK
jgi:hypothetical protein